MTCDEAQDLMLEQLSTAATAGTVELDVHLSGCESCTGEYADLKRTLCELELPVQATPGFAGRVLAAARQQESERRRWWRVSLPRLGLAAALACAIVLCFPFLSSWDSERVPVPELLHQSVLAMSKLRSLHITARVSGMPVDIWRAPGNSGNWRAECPSWVIMPVGDSTIEYHKETNVLQEFPHERKPMPWFQELVRTEDILEDELRLIRAGTETFSLTEERRFLGGRELVLQTRRKAARDLSPDMFRGENADVEQSRTYRFDAATRRLLTMRVVLHGEGGDRTVLETIKARYDEPVDPALFVWTPPKNVLRLVKPEEMPRAHPLPESAKDAARVYLEAFEREDWALALTVVRLTGIPETLKSQWGGLRIVSIGEPRETRAEYWHVPYEVKLRGGYLRRGELRFTYTSTAHRWVMDGWF